MKIEVSTRGIKSTEAITAHIDKAVTHAVGRFSDRITRVEVHLGDENSHKPGPHDKRVMIEARPAGMDPIAVETHGDDLYGVITDAAGKLGRAVTKKFEKLASNH